MKKYYKKWGVQRQLINNIKSRQLRCLGHITRAEGLECLSSLGKIEGKRSRGRQRSTISRNAIRWFGNNIDCNEIFRRAKNKELWRTMIANVCVGLDSKREKHSLLIQAN